MRCVFSLLIPLWIAGLAFALGSGSPAGAQTGMPDNVVRADVVPGWQTERGTRMAALELTLAPGWKTYWRAPGDAGIPPTFDWAGSQNLAEVTIHWPTPDVFTIYGMRVIGYADRLILPLELRPQRAGQPIRLRGEMELGVCETVCIPAELSFAADLGPGGRIEPAIRAALADQPASARSAGVGQVTCALTPIPDGAQIDVRVEMPRIGASEVAVIEADPSVWVSEPQVARSGGDLRVRAELVPLPGVPLLVDRSQIRITVFGAGRAVDIRGCD